VVLFGGEVGRDGVADVLGSGAALAQGLAVGGQQLRFGEQRGRHGEVLGVEVEGGLGDFPHGVLDVAPPGAFRQAGEQEAEVARCPSGQDGQENLNNVLKEAFADMRGMERVVRASGLEWTIVRPPMLTDGSRTGAYRRALERNVRGGIRVSRADLADCILRCLEERSPLNAAVSIGN
jgi:hypothetical protein